MRGLAISLFWVNKAVNNGPASMRVCVALSKLVDNAVKYARAGEVAITARSPVLG